MANGHLRVDMVKLISLSDPAFAALQREKRKGESDSGVVLRLLEEVGRARKDPKAFLRMRDRIDPMMPAEEHKAWVRKMREADRRGASVCDEES